MKLWKMILPLISLLAAQSALAVNVKINCASTNLGTTYAITTPSLNSAFTRISFPQSAHLAIFNATDFRVCFNTVTSSATTAPTAGNGNEHCVAPQTVMAYDGINSAVSVSSGVPNYLTSIYVRSDVSTCTSGIIDLDLW